MTEKTDDFRESVENETLEYPDPWKPEPEDVLIATVTGYDKANTRYGKQYVCNVRRESDGEELAVWLSSKVLLQEFKEKEPAPEERIGIKYHGKDDEKEYCRYTLKVDRDSEEKVPDFDDADPPRDAGTVQPDEPESNGAGEKPGDAVADKIEEQHGDKKVERKNEPITDEEEIPF